MSSLNPSPASAAAPCGFARVHASAAALSLIANLQSQHGRDLIFHQSGGCCDGSAPMLFPRAEFPLGDHDVLLGHIGGLPFYMSEAQFGYWQHTCLTIDAIPGTGGMFSLERPTGLRFLTRSRLFTAAEQAQLGPVYNVGGTCVTTGSTAVT